MLINLKQKISWVRVLFILSLATFIVYAATSGGTTPYNYFIRLAAAFLHGKFYLTQNLPWLNELVPIGANRFAVVYPPAPALISIPFVGIFGTNFPQQIIAQGMGALAAFIWGLIAYQKSKNKLSSLWVFLIAALGNIVWFMSSNGSVWYLGQVSGYLFLSLALYESLNKKRPLLTGIYFGLAILSRLQIILALPIIIYLNLSEFKNIKKLIAFGLPLVVFGVSYVIYNFLRFGSFLQTGYALIPGVLNESWFNKGLFNFSYIPNHLRILFGSLPIFTKTLPFIKPSWGGLAIWITSPVFVYLFKTKLTNKQNIFTWVSLVLIAILVMTHGSTGFAQFGYRFAVDFYPLILLLIVEGLGRENPKWHQWFLLIISILVNFWGVIWINKMGWVGW